MTENEAKLKLLMEKATKKGTAALANKISEQILVGLKANNKELHNIFAELTVEIAALSRRMDEAQEAPVTDFDASFGKLADSLNKDVVASLSDAQVETLAVALGTKLSEVVSALNIELARRDLADTVEVKGLDKMLTKLVDKIPKKIDGKVTLAYNRAAAKDFINVRLTDGQAFIDNLVGASKGSGLPLIKTSSGVFALPVVNPDGTTIGGSSTTSDPRTGYGFSDSATVSAVDYVGYINKDGNWFIMRIEDDHATYFTGNDINDYIEGTGFGAWASVLAPYEIFSEAF